MGIRRTGGKRRTRGTGQEPINRLLNRGNRKNRGTGEQGRRGTVGTGEQENRSNRGKGGTGHEPINSLLNRRNRENSGTRGTVGAGETAGTVEQVELGEQGNKEEQGRSPSIGS